MGLSHSPKVVTDGLVLCIDLDNLKSYKGPPIQNTMKKITGATANTTGIVFTPGTESVNIPEVGTVTSVTVTGYNDYPALSNNCCPALFRYDNSEYVPVSPNTLYTYAILYKVDSGYTHPNFMYRYEYTSANAYVTEAGVHNTSNRIHLGNGWYWAWGTFTTQATTAKIVPYSFYYQYRTNTNPDKMSVAKVLLVQGDYTKLHPKYWVDVNTTRVNTQVLFDLTNTNTITANNLTYSNTGSFEFSGTGQFVSYNAAELASNTIEFVIYNPGGQTDNYPSIHQQYGQQATFGFTWVFLSGNSTTIRYQYASTAVNEVSWSNAAPVGAYTHLAFVADHSAQNVTMYKNGVLVSTQSTPGIKTIPAATAYIGNYGGSASTSYDLKATLTSYKVYNKALTSAEVKQNFNAIRGRYGI